MSHTHISTAFALGACLSTSPALAQSTRTQQIDQDKAVRAAEIQTPVRERRDTIVSGLERLFGSESPTLRVTLGGFRPGAGLGAGVTHSTLVGERGLWTTATAWSINNFKQGLVKVN